MLKMRPALALLPLFVIFLFAATVESRKDAGEYWKMVMKDQELPEGIQGLLQLTSEIQTENNPKIQEQLKHKCEEPLVTNTQVTIEKKVFKEDFEPRPSITKYDGDEPLVKVNSEFEPRPSVTKYDGDEPQVSSEFEPRPSLTKYDGEEPLVNSEFEPRPSVTKYDGEEPLVNSEFEPRPSVTKYDGEEPLVNNKFEPRPSVTKYNG
ncbi:organ-specific protein P4-like [Gastrolobium bilobum]|uniref:organ-specific protein P4-like n=1 Tax=Gastrolobium bilobum TaxID=150636 RepID=UPI002AAF867B|nr:organ-specific protein P4-like [Gastrolobium bilobum]